MNDEPSMDFTLDEQQQAVFDLSGQILGDKLDMERLREIEAADEWFDRDLWAELAKAGLIGIGLAEDVGGGAQDLVALAQVLRAQGATVAPLPLLPTMLAALAIDAHGSADQRTSWLPGVVDGSTVLSVAVQEPFDENVTRPGVTFINGTITGTKTVVEFSDQAARLVVTATGPDGPALFLVDGSDPSVTRSAHVSTRLEPLHELSFDATPAEPLGHDPAAVDWLIERLLAALCDTQIGVSETALSLTADYTTTRQQFGRPIATFQAVTQRLADQYINVNGIRLTTFAALWALAHDRPASDDVLIAKWWASERAQEVVHASQHCHGGMGVSVDYPLFRYTLWSKHLTTSLGAGTRQLRALGAGLADTAS